MTRWLVDGANVVGSRPDGWWRDRSAAFERLAGELARYARDSGDDVTVVFDGPPLDVEGGGVTVVAAPYADDRMVELAASDPDRASLTAVTSDRDLAERLRRLGTEVTGSGSFRRLLDGVADR